MVQEYVRYPLVMKHPSHRPAVIRHMVASTNLPPDAAQQFQSRVGQDHPQQGAGAAELYPDVIVRSEDDEAYYISRGYRPAGGADPAGARTIQAAPLPANYRPQQWPQAVGDRVLQDPNAPTGDPNEYPKYLAALDRLVYSREEEDALTAPPDPEGATIVVADKKYVVGKRVSKSPQKTTYVPNPERVELLKMCRDLGIKHFAGWSVEKLRRLIEEATAPKSDAA